MVSGSEDKKMCLLRLENEQRKPIHIKHHQILLENILLKVDRRRKLFNYRYAEGSIIFWSCCEKRDRRIFLQEK